MNLFAEKAKGDHFVDAYEETISSAYLELFYKFIWFKLRTPEIDNIGKKYFEAYANDPDY